MIRRPPRSTLVVTHSFPTRRSSDLFYQSSTLVAHVPAIETQSDFDQKSINFVQLLPYNEQRIKIIYGSMDFNAYTFIRIKAEISDQN